MSKFSRKFAGILVGLLLTTPLAAAETKIALKPDHPDNYVVQADDTLWSIADRFLAAPWQWPAVWRGNPQLSDPNTIFPGDKVSLSHDAKGQPILVGTTSIEKSEQLSELLKKDGIPQMVILSIKGDWHITLQQAGHHFHSLPIALETSICVQQIESELFVFALVPARAQSQHQPSI